jgi:hypothetical protein
MTRARASPSALLNLPVGGGPGFRASRLAMATARPSPPADVAHGFSRGPEVADQLHNETTSCSGGTTLFHLPGFQSPSVQGLVQRPEHVRPAAASTPSHCLETPYG